ncbi:Flagellar hook-associated protein FlgK [Candidatus Rhodobacter oscarellae]|uniref:Flagellar hook-associated protein 1 n=1 Tax=Candidatus Rhodobacter oscarellae TaxID=1675527 RepID=A0A0J9EE80_9RHOB|nr:flagellar hook-associated protein FlgK [Candidatus Rhodobacter lobularis]KMW60034.1 Flagellar hook-associated protein FlgK [Candidatus Rhodobacter lobularis]
MTNLSTSLQNALSGLNVLSRITETVSSNVANSSNEHYAAREAVIGQRVIGGVGFGAGVVGVLRDIDPVLQGERRFAEAELAKTSARADFYAAMEAAIGLPDEPGSLSGRLAQFGAELINASSRPDSESRLQSALDAAQGVARGFNTASDAVQRERLQADRAIAEAVNTVNTALSQIQDLNAQIVRGGSQTLALADERMRLVDQISELIPMREIQRENGSIALFTQGGAILLDISAAELGFTSAGLITPEMNVGAGSLSGLTINGKPVSTSADKGPIAGGKLGALFDVRDVQATAVQTRLDAAARDFIERFETPAVDPTLTAGDPGLFTDGGAALDVTLEVGLAGRISVNALADPSQGGALWRLRDGLGAAAPGAAGDATLLNALSDALGATRSPATGGFLTQQTAFGIAGELIGGVAGTQSAYQSEQSYARARADTLLSRQLERGVDTDSEMQRLLQVEQAFAANAKVISTIDELIETLLRI